MPRKRLTITLNPAILKKLDKTIDGKHIRNRSHAIEAVLKQNLSANISTALILSAGKLVKTTSSAPARPSSLIHFKNQPILKYQLDLLRTAGITKVILCVGPYKKAFESVISTIDTLDLTVLFSEEKAPKGTATTVLAAKEYITNSAFLVIHGDILTNIDLEHFLNAHDPDRYDATIALTTVSDPKQFGMVKVKGSEVVKFFEKPKTEKTSNLISAGVYVLEPIVLNLIQESGAKSMEKEVFPMLAKQERLDSYMSSEKWFDLSYKEFYERALREF